jgi:DNA segregation ATPase FtsK/SpoIIIE, S-DNA-T family
MKQGNTRLARLLLRIAGITNALMFFPICCEATANGAAGVMTIMLLPLGFWVVALLYATSNGYWFERRCERVWKAVCSGIDGFKGVARSYRFGLIGAFVLGDTKTIYPKLRDVHGSHEAWTGIVIPFAGQTIEEYNEHTKAFALAFNVRFVSFERTDTGLVRVRCGPVQVPEMYEYPVERSAELLPYAADSAAVLKAVPMARTIDGRPWYLTIEGNHLLIAGRTGAGKNSYTWSLVFGLAKARQAGVVRLWGLDPKKVELAFGRECWDEYADTIDGMVDLLEKAVSDLLERNKLIQGKARKIVPSPAMPLNVIIIDELAYLSVMVPDKKLRDRAQAAIGTILVLGRATGYSLIGCSQDVRKEVLGFLDYFPTKIALAMEAPMVDLVLGEGAHDIGMAHCEQIPLREAGAGCAYVKEELGDGMLLVRAAWCSDEAIRMMMNPQAFGVQVQCEPTPQYGQGYVPQLGWNDQPLPDLQYRVNE